MDYQEIDVTVFLAGCNGNVVFNLKNLYNFVIL